MRQLTAHLTQLRQAESDGGNAAAEETCGWNQDTVRVPLKRQYLIHGLTIAHTDDRCRASQNPIPRKGEWGEISGDEFLLKMMMSPPQTIENPYTFERLTIEPRNLAMRILEVRARPRRRRRSVFSTSEWAAA